MEVVNLNKKGLVGKILLIILIVIIIVLFSKFGKADVFTYYNNVTVSQNYTDFNLNLSGNFYFFYNNNSIINTFISQPIIIDFVSVIQNTTFVYQNITSNVSCAANNTLIISCSCPSLSCPSIAVSNCSIAQYSVDGLKTKIEEGYSKAATDIVFQLKPTTVELEALRAVANNATGQKNEALLEAAKQLEQNIRLGEVIQNERKTHDAEVSSLKTERTLLFAFDMVMFLAVIYLLSDAYGLWDRLRNLGFRRGGY